MAGALAAFALHPFDGDPRRLAMPARGAPALVTSGGAGADAALIAAMPRLEIVAVHGVGCDAVDLAAARTRGIRVVNTPDVLTDDVADLAIGLIVAVSRRLCAGDAFVRAGRWVAADALPLARRASGRRLGIFGLGRIGKAVARRAEPMMASISYSGRRAQPDAPYPFVADLRALASQVDILVVTAAGGADAGRPVGRDVLEALGPEGMLINVARGSLVDEAALVDLLANGGLGGAGLDVFAEEPFVPPRLLALGNVVLQPHRGSATVESRRAMARLVAANLEAHFAGEPLLTPVE